MMKQLNQIVQLLSTILHPLAPVNSATLPECRHYGFWESMRIAWIEQRARKHLWTE